VCAGYQDCSHDVLRIQVLNAAQEMWRFVAGLYAVAVLASPAFADFTGPVVSVLDGDTLEVLCNNHPERICLNGINRHET
jgi:endonuclease YncB( thermonuclease family)